MSGGALWQTSGPLRTIAIFRALQLGDMLCAVPALRALRVAAPQAQIVLIGLPWAENFVQRFSAYLDDFVPFPGFPAFPEQPARLDAMPGFLAKVQARRFDLAIQMHGSGSLSNPLLILFNAFRCAGFYPHGQFCPDRDRFIEWDAREHEIRRYLRLTQFLGVAPQGEQLEFPLTNTDYQALHHTHSELPVPGAYVCIHPGARLPSRRWLPQRFAEVADRLALAGMRIVLTGSSDETEVVRQVQHSMRMPALNLSGKTELGTLAALIAQARLVVANDTAISHIAAAVATPSIIVCCGADPARWAPPDPTRHCVLSVAVDCRPCMYQTCPIGHPCAQEMSVETVAVAALHMLGAHTNVTEAHR
jgi:ADP-heptose:LPS heptosyltransferase